MDRVSIPYAKAGETPTNWFDAKVTREGAEEPIQDVHEANAEEGWFVQTVTDPQGQPLTDEDGAILTRKVTAAITITVPRVA